MSEGYSCNRIFYVAGINLDHAMSRSTDEQYRSDTPGGAYDKLGYFEEQDNRFEVFEFKKSTNVSQVNPPYAR